MVLPRRYQLRMVKTDFKGAGSYKKSPIVIILAFAISEMRKSPAPTTRLMFLDQ